MSSHQYSSYEEKGENVEVVVVNPNIDCYNEKFILDYVDLVKKYENLSFTHLTKNTDYLLWPETAITNGGLAEEMQYNDLFIHLKDTLKLFPKTKLITGVLIYGIYNSKEPKQSEIPYLNFSKSRDLWYYTYNGAMQLQYNKKDILLRTKQALIPFEEALPYPKLFAFISKFIKKVGNFTFSARKHNDNIFHSENNKASAFICYEAMFGDLIARNVDKGSDLLFILLNEGWYGGDQNQAKQFLYYCTIPAIENRRSIARCSNGGINCFISQHGEIYNLQESTKTGALKGNLLANKEKTFYTKHRDYIGKIAVIGLFILLVYTIYSASLKGYTKKSTHI